MEKLMRKMSALALTIFLLLARVSQADLPHGFSWVNIETDKAIMAKVRHVLHGTSISVIREVGVEDGFALVMTASREAGAPTPDYDQWSIYNIVLDTGKSQLLISGYGVKLLDWIGPAKNELAVTYYDCWECEAATLFTTLHFTKGSGWSARWPQEKQNAENPQPGAVALMTDVGDPYDGDDVDQVFAVVSGPRDSFAVGSWTHSRNTKTGKIDDGVERYSIDFATGRDRVEKLGGQAALNWERRICASTNIIVQPSIGQASKACREILRTQPHVK
jgi:hypothetical protein